MGTDPPGRCLQRRADARPRVRGARLCRPSHELGQPVGPERVLDADLLSDDWAGVHGRGVLFVLEEDCGGFWGREFEVEA